MAKSYKDALLSISITPFGKYITSKRKVFDTPDTLPTTLGLSYFDLNPGLLDDLSDLLTKPRSELLPDSTSWKPPLFSWISSVFHRIVETVKSHIFNIGLRSVKVADISPREDNAEYAASNVSDNSDVLNQTLQSYNNSADTASNGSANSDTSNESLQPYKKLTLKAFLDKRHHITKLDLVKVGVSDENVESFAKLLDNNNIQEVDLQWNKISTKAALVMVKEVIKHPNIKYVNLANNEVGDDFVKKIKPELEAVKHRLTIDLHRKHSKTQIPELEDVEHNITVHDGILECHKPSEDITVFKKQPSAWDIQQASDEAMQFVNNMFGVPESSEHYMDRAPGGCAVSVLTGALNAWEEEAVFIPNAISVF